MPINMPVASAVQKHSQFSDNQIQETWMNTMMEMLTSNSLYVLPRYATKKVMVQPNTGLGDIKVARFRPFKDDSFTEYGPDATAAGDPLPTASTHISMNIKRLGAYTVATRTLMSRDAYAAEWVSTYKMEFTRIVLAALQNAFKEELKGTGDNGTGGASRFYGTRTAAAGNNPAVQATKVSDVNYNANLDHILAIRDKMRNHTILASDGSTQVDAVIPGFNNASGEYVVVHSQEFFDFVSQSEKFRDLINKGFSAKEYIQNDFSTYFGLRFQKIPRRWEIADATNTNTKRDVAMVIGGSAGKEAIAKIEFNHAWGMEFFYIEPPRTANNPMDLYKALMGVMFYYGFKVLRPKSVYLYIYKTDAASTA